jgi:hypothetical protein
MWQLARGGGSPGWGHRLPVWQLSDLSWLMPWGVKASVAWRKRLKRSWRGGAARRLWRLEILRLVSQGPSYCGLWTVVQTSWTSGNFMQGLHVQKQDGNQTSEPVSSWKVCSDNNRHRLATISRAQYNIKEAWSRGCQGWAMANQKVRDLVENEEEEEEVMKMNI